MHQKITSCYVELTLICGSKLVDKQEQYFNVATPMRATLFKYKTELCEDERNLICKIHYDNRFINKNYNSEKLQREFTCTLI